MGTLVQLSGNVHRRALNRDCLFAAGALAHNIDWQASRWTIMEVVRPQITRVETMTPSQSRSLGSGDKLRCRSLFTTACGTNHSGLRRMSGVGVGRPMGSPLPNRSNQGGRVHVFGGRHDAGSGSLTVLRLDPNLWWRLLQDND